MLERIDSKSGEGFKNVQELLVYVNGEGHQYRSQYSHEILNQNVPAQAKVTEKRTATFNELFGTLSAGNPIVSKYYGLQKNKELSRLKQNKDLSEADRAKRIAELEASEAAGKLYENYIQTFPINYVYPPTINEYQEMVRKAEEERKKQEEEMRKAKEKAWWDIGKQVLEAVAMVVVATFVPGGPLIVAAYVAGKMAATALNGNIDPISGEKVDGFGYATMALDALPGLGAMGKFAKGTKVATTAGKIVSGSQRVEKVISTVAKGAKTITQFGAKALKFYDNPLTQMAITAYQTNGDPMSIMLAGAGMGGSLAGKMRNSQKLAGLITKAPKAVQKFANATGKVYDKVSGLGTKLNNKINAMAEKSQNAISNFFGKAKNKLGDKLSDFGMKARSLGVKHVEVPVLAMPGGGSIGRPLKIPVGVGINQTKLDKLRQIKANKAANLNARGVANKVDDVAEDLARSASRNKSSQLNHTASEAGNHQGAGRPGQTHKELENDLNRKKVADVSKDTSHQTPPHVENVRHLDQVIADVKPENVVTPIKSKPKVGVTADGRDTKVVVTAVSGDKVGYGVNQESAVFKNIGGEIEHKSPKRLKDEARGIPVPNLTPETAHAEIQALASLNRAGELKGKDVILYIEFSEGMKLDQLKSGKKGYDGMCGYCKSDVKYYAQEAQANSVTVIDTQGNKMYWKLGDKSWTKL